MGINFRCKKGFTISELILVMALMTIFAALSAPGVLGFRAKCQLNGAARQVVGDLTAARMEAVKQSCNVILNFENPVEYSFVVDKNNNNAFDSGENKRTRNLESYPGVQNIRTDTKNIFNSRGAMRRMRTITLQNGKRQVNITISISGRIKMD